MIVFKAELEAEYYDNKDKKGVRINRDNYIVIIKDTSLSIHSETNLAPLLYRPFSFKKESKLIQQIYEKSELGGDDIFINGAIKETKSYSKTLSGVIYEVFEIVNFGDGISRLEAGSKWNRSAIKRVCKTKYISNTRANSLLEKKD